MSQNLSSAAVVIEALRVKPTRNQHCLCLFLCEWACCTLCGILSGSLLFAKVPVYGYPE